MKLYLLGMMSYMISYAFQIILASGQWGAGLVQIRSLAGSNAAQIQPLLVHYSDVCLSFSASKSVAVVY